MKHLLLLIAAVLVAMPAAADPADDYLACLVGQAMVQIRNDSEDPLGDASEVCPEPDNLGEDDAEIIGDVANMAVDALVAAFK